MKKFYHALILTRLVAALANSDNQLDNTPNPEDILLLQQALELQQPGALLQVEDDTEADAHVDKDAEFPTYSELGTSCSSYTSADTCPDPECVWSCSTCVSSCFQPNVSYNPLDTLYVNTPGGEEQVKASRETSAVACQARCAGITGCTGFSYYTTATRRREHRIGKCYLSNSSSSLRVVRGDLVPGAVAGPVACQQTSTQESAASAASSQSPADIMGCSANRTLTTQCMTKADYAAITAEVHAIMNGLSSSCDASVCPRADFAGCVLRMAGHDFMDFRWVENNGTYSTPTGGSDGCIDFAEADNAGLQPCLLGAESAVHDGLDGVGIDSIYHNWCTTISLADFFVVAAEAVMSYTRVTAVGNSTDPGFASRFKYGRTTKLSCSELHGRMPDPENGCAANQEVFLDNLLLDWKHTAALMGVHTLGRVHLANSGYHGWWSDPENSVKFNNNYYHSMLTKSWKPRGVQQECGSRVVASWDAQLPKNQWDLSGDSVNEIGGPDSFLTSANQMMLNTDLCLLYDDFQAASAKEQCGCQWAMPNEFMGAFDAIGGNWCGRNRQDLISGQLDFVVVLDACCDAADTTCGNPDMPQGPARRDIKDFTENDTYWFETFKDAWNNATEIASPGLLRLLDDCAGSVPDDPEFDLDMPAETIAAREAAEAAAEEAEQEELNAARAAVNEEMLDRWHVGTVMNSCSYTCANLDMRCSVDHFEEHLDEVDTYPKVKALFEALLDQRPDQVKNHGFFGDWYGINSLQNVAQYYEMTGLQDASDVGDTVVGGGTTAAEQAFWMGNCRDGTLGETCTASDYTVKHFFCAENHSGPYPRTEIDGCSKQQYHNGTQQMQWGADGYEIWKQRVNGTFKGWYENVTCNRDQSPGGANPDQTFAPIIFFRDNLHQVPVVSGVCGWPNPLKVNGKPKLPADYCDRAYFSPRFRRLCPCAATTEQNPICPANSTNHKPTACMRNGLPDPDCCASQVEGGCAEGYQYSPGVPCRWRSHFQWISTVCCPNAQSTTTTTTIASIAAGWYLSPLGEINCTSTCQGSLTYWGREVKPAGMHCNFEGTSLTREELNTIVAAIGPRDFNGTGTFDWTSYEQEPPECLVNDTSNNFFSPYYIQTASCCIDSKTCYLPSSDDRGFVCDDPSFTNYHWEFLAKSRRLCKCTRCAPNEIQQGDECITTTTTTTTTTTITTTTTTTTPPVECPVGWMRTGSGAMCTDEAKQGWDGTHAINRKSGIADISACSERCDGQDGCNGFVYWETKQRCRTYTTCTHLRYQGSSEYAGSVACQKLTGF